MITQGNSNREIAETLLITVRTVEAHITRILDKLGLKSRAAIAAWTVVLQFYRDWTSELPDELTAACAVLTGPDGNSIIGIVACYDGNLAEGERVLAPLHKFGLPLIDRIQPMPYAGLFALLDAGVRRGRRYYMKGSGITALSDGAIDALVESAARLTSPYAQIALLPVHGAATRVGVTETAFAFREDTSRSCTCRVGRMMRKPNMWTGRGNRGKPCNRWRASAPT